jgi:hypothetical protein
MTTIQVIVTLLGVALSGFIAWSFWFAPKGQTRAVASAGGVQEVAVTGAAFRWLLLGQI